MNVDFISMAGNTNENKVSSSEWILGLCQELAKDWLHFRGPLTPNNE